MKAIYILLSTVGMLLLYQLFLTLFPLQKKIFFTNDERIEEYVFSDKPFSTVMVGSSLSGVFDLSNVLGNDAFNLYLPFTGSATGLEVLRRGGHIPKRIFVEINHVDRGVDTLLLNGIFSSPEYYLKQHLPFLRKKNQLFSNVLDRYKTPANNTINNAQPPAALYATLLASEQRSWNHLSDKSQLSLDLKRAASILHSFAKSGCEVWLFEMPMDRSLADSKILTFERDFFVQLAAKRGYRFISADRSNSYLTGDGIHLLRADGLRYLDYFSKQLTLQSLTPKK